MTRVYGGCVEPGGFVLDNDVDVVECPSCGGEALSRFRETCEGGAINLNHTIICTECDHAEGDLPDSYFDEPINDDARDAVIEALLADLGL